MCVNLWVCVRAQSRGTVDAKYFTSAVDYEDSLDNAPLTDAVAHGVDVVTYYHHKGGGTGDGDAGSGAAHWDAARSHFLSDAAAARRVLAALESGSGDLVQEEVDTGAWAP